MDLRTTRGWRLREAPFSHQRTFQTPLPDRADPSTRKNLSQFVKALLSPFEATSGEVRLEMFVFEPTELIWYLRGTGITADEGELNRASLISQDATETRVLLECVLGQWADFAFFPNEQTFAIYADHDEYTTVFSAKPECLDIISSAMEQEGFKEVEGWTWTGPHSQGRTDV